jgi:hypothetical protein
MSHRNKDLIKKKNKAIKEVVKSANCIQPMEERIIKDYDIQPSALQPIAKIVENMLIAESTREQLRSRSKQSGIPSSKHF